MMMIYGMFVFELRTLPHQQLQQNKSWRHVKNERVNRSASWQYIGAGDDRIVLSGVLYPEITGGEVSLSLLTTQAYTGRPWPLIDGVGQIYGMYVLTETNTTRSEFDRYGKAKKIEFSLTLEAVMRICGSACNPHRSVICCPASKIRSHHPSTARPAPLKGCFD
ncbi:tail fiber protein [Escherichia coli]|nr:tail fiber protein [Escherichia coli]